MYVCVWVCAKALVYAQVACICVVRLPMYVCMCVCGCVQRRLYTLRLPAYVLFTLMLPIYVYIGCLYIYVCVCVGVCATRLDIFGQHITYVKKNLVDVHTCCVLTNLKM
jgi:hypothetical protein